MKYFLSLTILLFSCNTPYVPRSYVLSCNFTPKIVFANYSIEEIERMEIYLMRNNRIMDTGFLKSRYFERSDNGYYIRTELKFKSENDTIVKTNLKFEFKSENNTIVKSDTVLFSIAGDIYKLYDIRKIAVKRVCGCCVPFATIFMFNGSEYSVLSSRHCRFIKSQK